MLRDFKMILPDRLTVGDKVYEITRPQQLMVITRKTGFLCYCSLIENESHEIAFMERDLKKEYDTDRSKKNKPLYT